jgi:hypothetical protein
MTFYLFIYFNRVLLRSPCWPRTRDAPASASWVLGLQARVTMPRLAT